MADLLSPQDIEQLGADAGLSVADICRRAGIAHSTFTRWRKGDTEPTLDVYRRIRNVVLPTVSTETPASSKPKAKRRARGAGDVATPTSSAKAA